MAKIYYARVDEFWQRGQKYAYLEERGHVGNIEWQELQPDAKHNWLTEGMRDEFETFVPIANKETKEGAASSAIFTNFSRGVETTRDTWLYNFNENRLIENVKLTINAYNEQVYKWQAKKGKDVDSFIEYDDRKIKWSSSLKSLLIANVTAEIKQDNFRKSLYRPFTIEFLYFDKILTHRRGQFPFIFPTPATEQQNKVICLAGVGDRKGFGCLITNYIAALDLAFEKIQCFPFYTYDEDGANRRENITDWALGQFRARYGEAGMEKWDIFYYVYAVLHHPLYRERYAANLKRELPRVPYAPDFRAFAEAGRRLAALHVDYEAQAEYPLERIENPAHTLDWRVQRMRLSKDKRSLVYNDFLTLRGIPAEAFQYRLGNRSALEWVIDQYQVTTDGRSGIVNDPNRPADPSYILRLLGQVITVSLETVSIVNSLPELFPAT